MALKILMMSKHGDGLGIAQKLAEDGHDVKFWIEEKGFDMASVGIVDRAPSWRPLASKWADLVVADMVGFGARGAQLDKWGVQHIGFNPVADTLELDRAKQMEVLRRVRIPLPETHQFDTPNMALDLLPVFRNGFVLKPSGNLDTGKTYICRNQDTFRWALEQYSGDQELVAQRIVEGVEVSTEGWFNGQDWLEPFNHTFEEKRFLEGDLGPNTGCMGNVVFPIKNGQRNKIVRELKKLTPFLKAAGYKGPIDMNAIVNKNGIHALELTARFGYDAIEALHTIMQEPFAAFLMGLVAGSSKNMRLKKDQYGMAVRLTVPPYPEGEVKKADRGLPVVGVPKDRSNYYLTDVYQDGDILRWAASDGVIMKVTSGAQSLDVLGRLAYAAVEKVKVMGLQYRRDIGKRVERDVKFLEGVGVEV